RSRRGAFRSVENTMAISWRSAWPSRSIWEVPGVVEVMEGVEEFTVIFRLLADTWPVFWRRIVALKSLPGVTLAGSCFSMLIWGRFWISTSLFTFTGIGYFRLLASETRIHISGK